MAKKQLTEYVNKQAITEVLGCLMQEPKLLREFKIIKEDFPETYHKLIFSAINNLYRSGAERVDAVAIDDYLSHFATKYKTFEKNDGLEYVQRAEEVALLVNFKYYYDQLKKFSLLRGMKQQGIDVSDFFDPNEIDPITIDSQREKLNSYSITDMVNHFKKKMLKATAPFIIGENRDSKKAGVGGHAQKEKWKQSSAWGNNYASGYLTTALHGLRKRRFTIRSAGTGVGKKCMLV